MHNVATKERIYCPQRRDGAKEEKSEIRIPKSETNVRADKSQMGKIQNTQSGGSLFGGLPRFGHLNLFRISDFVLRIFKWQAVVTAVLVVFAAGCDPVLNIGGTFFPGWMVAILIGSALTVAIRYIFVFTRVEPHLGPLALVYTSLGLLLSVVSWLILYRS
jgi:hypothetical protein